jgi:hypothetical protein
MVVLAKQKSFLQKIVALLVFTHDGHHEAVIDEVQKSAFSVRKALVLLKVIKGRREITAFKVFVEIVVFGVVVRGTANG